jgi:hypothetical protein
MYREARMKLTPMVSIIIRMHGMKNNTCNIALWSTRITMNHRNPTLIANENRAVDVDASMITDRGK